MAKKRELIIPGRYDRVLEACQFVANGATEAGFEPGEVFHIELACDEACTNVIQHAYGGEDVGDIHISWSVEGGAFIIVIRDRGRVFDSDEVPEPHFAEADDDFQNLRIGGLGIHFMRTLMDRVNFNFVVGEGNKLVMVKYLPQNERHDHHP